MDANDYPRAVCTAKGWLVETSKNAKLSGVYLNQRSAEQAIRSYKIQMEVAKEKRIAKRTKKED